MGCAGENPATCPPGDGRTELLVDDLPDPAGRRARRGLRLRAVPRLVGLAPAGIVHLGRRAHRAGRRRRPGSYDFYLTVTYDKTPACVKTPIGRSVHHQRRAAGAPAVRLDDEPARRPASTRRTRRPRSRVQNGTVSSWTLAGGSLPPGLTLGTNGVISGTPTQSGTFTLHRPGERLAEQRHEAALAVRARAARPRPRPERDACRDHSPSPVSMKLATPISWGVKATGGREPYTYTADRCPPGSRSIPDGTAHRHADRGRRDPHRRSP